MRSNPKPKLALVVLIAAIVATPIMGALVPQGEEASTSASTRISNLTVTPIAEEGEALELAVPGGLANISFELSGVNPGAEIEVFAHYAAADSESRVVRQRLAPTRLGADASVSAVWRVPADIAPTRQNGVADIVVEVGIPEARLQGPLHGLVGTPAKAVGPAALVGVPLLEGISLSGVTTKLAVAAGVTSLGVLLAEVASSTRQTLGRVRERLADDVLRHCGCVLLEETLPIKGDDGKILAQIDHVCEINGERIGFESRGADSGGSSRGKIADKAEKYARVIDRLDLTAFGWIAHASPSSAHRDVRKIMANVKQYAGVFGFGAGYFLDLTDIAEGIQKCFRKL